MALACPRCSTLLHRDRLEQLAALATAAAAAGERSAARSHWQEALTLVPVDSVLALAWFARTVHSASAM